MKKLLIYILLLSTILSSAQTDEAKTNLKQDIRNLMNAYKESDFKEAVKYIPDFVFDQVSKEEVLAQISQNPDYNTYEINQIKVDTIISIESVSYARFYIDSQISTYGIKTKSNFNWTFIDLNEMTKEYLPVEIRKTE